MKENTAQVVAQVPVDVATFLLNEKRTEVLSIETRFKVNVLLVPNRHLETPNYTVERLRHDDLNQGEPLPPSFDLVAAAGAGRPREADEGRGQGAAPGSRGQGHHAGPAGADPCRRPLPGRRWRRSPTSAKAGSTACSHGSARSPRIPAPPRRADEPREARDGRRDAARPARRARPSARPGPPRRSSRRAARRRQEQPRPRAASKASPERSAKDNSRATRAATASRRVKVSTAKASRRASRVRRVSRASRVRRVTASRRAKDRPPSAARAASGGAGADRRRFAAGDRGRGTRMAREGEAAAGAKEGNRRRRDRRRRGGGDRPDRPDQREGQPEAADALTTASSAAVATAAGSSVAPAPEAPWEVWPEAVEATAPAAAPAPIERAAESQAAPLEVERAVEQRHEHAEPAVHAPPRRSWRRSPRRHRPTSKPRPSRARPPHSIRFPSCPRSR